MAASPSAAVTTDKEKAMKWQIRHKFKGDQEQKNANYLRNRQNKLKKRWEMAPEESSLVHSEQLK